MKITNFRNTAICLISALSFAGTAVSCQSTKAEPPAPVAEEPAPPPVVEEPAPVVEELPPVIEQEPEPVIEEPATDDDEYSRSVGDVAVSRDAFSEDKEKILSIIAELDNIMKDPASNKSYNAWIGYVAPASIDYWKIRKNLQKAEKKLPVKGVKLQTLQDYFKLVFVPARRGREVTEIRYISDTYIKAVQVQEEQITVYYYFNKVDGKWMIHLPTNEEFS
ncbi:hypothetical protein [uncultured Treponema sp.]|uniref:hypothetical protein n=1 Tax=uncultured Treponema sp. TaxID=162155 RepID=UPI0025FA6203|nr:hypothetical protein [uncultured Treponema sp.]